MDQKLLSHAKILTVENQNLQSHSCIQYETEFSVYVGTISWDFQPSELEIYSEND